MGKGSREELYLRRSEKNTWLDRHEHEEENE